MNSPTTSPTSLRRIGVIATALACAFLFACGGSDGNATDGDSTASSSAGSGSGSGSTSGASTSGGDKGGGGGEASVTVKPEGESATTVEIELVDCLVSDQKMLVRAEQGQDTLNMSDTTGGDPTFIAKVGGRSVGLDSYDAPSVTREDGRFLAAGKTVDGGRFEVTVNCS